MCIVANCKSQTVHTTVYGVANRGGVKGATLCAKHAKRETRGVEDAKRAAMNRYRANQCKPYGTGKAKHGVQIRVTLDCSLYGQVARCEMLKKRPNCSTWHEFDGGFVSDIWGSGYIAHDVRDTVSRLVDGCDMVVDKITIEVRLKGGKWQDVTYTPTPWNDLGDEFATTLYELTKQTLGIKLRVGRS